MSKQNILVTYFSCTGTTARAAKGLAKAVGGKLYEIKPVAPYTSEDLNWNNKESRSTREMRDPGFRPPIEINAAEVEAYDTIFVGFPIWWYTAPTIINTFLESFSLEGKTIIPFATSGGSTISKAESDLRQAYPAAAWGQGKMLNSRVTKGALEDWLKM